MTKPWEQEWKYDADVKTMYSGTLEVGKFIDDTDGEFGAAAPDMARALMRRVAEHCDECTCGGCTALRKAGVIP